MKEFNSHLLYIKGAMSQDFRHLFYWLKTLFAYLQYCIGPGPLVNKLRQFCEFSDFAKIIAIMSVVNVVVVLIFKQNVRIIMPVIYNTAQQYRSVSFRVFVD